MFTDPIADYLTRIRNAAQAGKRVVEIPGSNLKKDITRILFEKGYILSYKFEDDGKQGHEELLWLTPEAHHEVADGNEHQRVQNVTWYLKFRNKCYHSNI